MRVQPRVVPLGARLPIGRDLRGERGGRRALRCNRASPGRPRISVKSITRFGRRRSPVSVHLDQAFRSMAFTGVSGRSQDRLISGRRGGGDGGRRQLPKRAAGEGDAVRVMHEPIEDCIAKRGVPDQVVPVDDHTWQVTRVARRPVRSSMISSRSRRSRSPRGASPQSSKISSRRNYFLVSALDRVRLH